MTLIVSLILLGALGWISLTRLRWQSARLRQALRHADKAEQETASGIAGSLAIDLCMDSELRWAVRQGVPAAVLVLSVRAGDAEVAGERLAATARRFERACAIDDEPAFAILLWNVDETGARASADRLGAAMAGDDGWTIEAGSTMVPGEALGAREAIAIALGRRTPIGEVAPAAAAAPTLRSA